MEFLNWLRSFTSSELGPYHLCQVAFEDRKSTYMQQLERLAREPEYTTSTDSIRNDFAVLRHNIGRLGHHIRIAKKLVESASRMTRILQSWRVEPIPTPPRVLLPLSTDRMTTLDGIVTRMLGSDSEFTENYKTALEDMDKHFQLQKRLLDNYENPNFSPRVHCEVQVLEHFCRNNFQFVDLDRYVACSKDACYCCSLYFRYHPGNFVEPKCHHNIYLSWKPPDFESRIQQDILNAMVKHIRKDALDQISKRHPAHPCHPDSNTGITMSLSAKVRDIDLSDSNEQDSESQGSGECNETRLNVNH
jgi:hypothetical protein